MLFVFLHRLAVSVHSNLTVTSSYSCTILASSSLSWIALSCRSQIARLANMDPSWSMGSGLNTHHNPQWLHLYLAACKLLDLALIMPTEYLPQFQLWVANSSLILGLAVAFCLLLSHCLLWVDYMYWKDPLRTFLRYRWAFIGEPHTEKDKRKKKRNQHPGFTPHVIRIAKLMDTRVRTRGIYSNFPLFFFFKCLKKVPFCCFSTVWRAQGSAARSWYPHADTVPHHHHPRTACLFSHNGTGHSVSRQLHHQCHHHSSGQG